eukprot:GHVL01029728.1.p1 GENE.GHVL01029728.1~~GHVL01029728.1.p1  ORF type:complete len:110 (+),score=27.56 GHVL01029728.1:71-400(+)
MRINIFLSILLVCYVDQIRSTPQSFLEISEKTNSEKTIKNLRTSYLHRNSSSEKNKSEKNKFENKGIEDAYKNCLKQKYTNVNENKKYTFTEAKNICTGLARLTGGENK